MKRLPIFQRLARIGALCGAALVGSQPLAPCPATASENWPQWRGPGGNGVSDSTGLPTAWGPEKNVVWKVALPSWSGGTPVIWGDRIFLTSPSALPAAEARRLSPQVAGQNAPGRPQRDEQEQRRRGRGRGRGGGGGGGGYGGARSPGGSALLLLCLSKADGSLLWQREIDQGNRLWRKQNSSSPSPVTDGKHVWVVTGTGAVGAFDMDGAPLWDFHLQKEYGEFGLNWGYASSPALHDGKLIIQVLHGNNTDEPSYLVALDALTGKVAWRQERPTDAQRESPDAYTTPALYTQQGDTRVIVSGGDYVTAHDPATGKEIWRAGGLNPRRASNYRIIASPVVAGDLVIAPSRKRPLLALKTGGAGDVSQSHLAWTYEDDGGPDVPTPVSDGPRLYLVDDSGKVTCLETKTGRVVWGPERTAIGTVSASPLLADGKLYIVNESAVTSVVAAGPSFQMLATNELDGTYTLSSPAVSGRQLFLRTSTHLYCLADTPTP